MSSTSSSSSVPIDFSDTMKVCIPPVGSIRIWYSWNDFVGEISCFRTYVKSSLFSRLSDSTLQGSFSLVSFSGGYREDNFILVDYEGDQNSMRSVLFMAFLAPVWNFFWSHPLNSVWCSNIVGIKSFREWFTICPVAGIISLKPECSPNQLLPW